MTRPHAAPDFKKLLPPAAETCVSDDPASGQTRLPDAELRATATMRTGRRREFTHGRSCARRVLTALDLPDRAIPVGPHREPIWPDGIVGSITHCGAVAAAAAGRSGAIGGIGIDIETDAPLDDSSLDLICLAAELTWLRDGKDARNCAKLIFSAKESIFKCIWPTVRRFVDFRDVEIRIDAAHGTFAPAHWADDLPAAVIGAVAGRYEIRDGWIMTAASLPPKRE